MDMESRDFKMTKWRAKKNFWKKKEVDLNLPRKEWHGIFPFAIVGCAALSQKANP